MLARPPVLRSTRPACSPLSRLSTRYVETQGRSKFRVLFREEKLPNVGFVAVWPQAQFPVARFLTACLVFAALFLDPFRTATPIV